MLQTLLLLAATALTGIVVFAVLNRPKLIVVSAAPPERFPPDSFSHDTFRSLLRGYVDDSGRIRYDAWHDSAADQLKLDQYLAAVCRYSPESAPGRFQTRCDELAYWVYAYNAVVIKSVLMHWPINSVTEVKAPLELMKGLGFFWQRRFLFGGKVYSLYAIENDIIRNAFRDARIHFVLNCGSRSCPVMQPDLAQGGDLDAYLQSAAESFVSDPHNLLIDHRRKRIVLSPIFKWYRNDFIDDLESQGTPARPGLIAYLQSIAPASVRDNLVTACSYAIKFRNYDWSLNHAEAP